MKKYICLLLAMAMTLSLAACAATEPVVSQAPQATPDTVPDAAPDAAPEATPEAPQEPAPSEAPEAEPGEEPAQTEAPEGGKTLVAYFSWSGNTETLANMIQAATGADIFLIAPETPYTDDYDDLLDVAQQEQADNARPALDATVENWQDYDVVFVGYPNWWADVPMVILSFLESYDCTGKTIIPFCTSGGGGFGSGIDSITDSAAGATIAEGFHVNGSRVDRAEDDVNAWIAGLGL